MPLLQPKHALSYKKNFKLEEEENAALLLHQ